MKKEGGEGCAILGDSTVSSCVVCCLARRDATAVTGLVPKKRKMELVYGRWN